MFISKKRHQLIVEDLKKKLEQANDLKDILQKLNIKSDNTTVIGSSTLKWETVVGGYEVNLPDNVLVYVDDLLGGKVIKQEGTKCIVIESDGSVKTGLTKEAPDKGFNYRLLRK